MAFGNGLSSKTHDFRSVPLVVGSRTVVKDAALRELRDRCLAALQVFSDAAFEHEPLNGTVDRKRLTASLLRLQKGYQGLNKAYLERCRTSVIAGVAEQHKRYLAQLIGRLCHCAEEIPAHARRRGAPDTAARRYYYVPLEVQAAVTEKELQDLQLRAAKPDAALKLFRRMLAGQVRGLTSNQIAVLREIHRQVQERHRPPVYGGLDTEVALPLDYRVLDSTWRDLPGSLEHVACAVLCDEDNRRFPFFVAIAHPVPGNPRIRIPLEADRALLEPLLVHGRKDFVARGLTLLLGPGTVQMRLTVAQEKAPPKPVDAFKYALGRDFGHRNTVTLSLVKLERALSAKKVEELQGLSKEGARQWLTGNGLDAEPDVAARLRFSGARFLARVHELALQIDATTGLIDTGYAALEAQKLLLAGELHLEPDADGLLPRLTVGMAARDSALRGRIVQFLNQLSHLKNLKAKRRALYGRISGVKKSWFGHLANIERAVALQWGALVVAEDLDYVTEEKDGPGYKGRTFNRMINHASRGQYARCAQQKHDWSGTPVVRVPSYFTSTTCFLHRRIGSDFRRQDVFACGQCRAQGRPAEHADEHAADTLAVYLTLEPALHQRDTQPFSGKHRPSGR